MPSLLDSCSLFASVVRDECNCRLGQVHNQAQLLSCPLF